MNLEDFDNFFLIKLFQYKTIDWKIYQFFCDRHRGQLLKCLPFSKFFVKYFIKRLKEFRYKNSINDGGQINSVKTFQDILNYISFMKINYMKYYDLIMSK